MRETFYLIAGLVPAENLRLQAILSNVAIIVQYLPLSQVSAMFLIKKIQLQSDPNRPLNHASLEMEMVQTHLNSQQINIKKAVNHAFLCSKSQAKLFKS